MTGNYNNMDDGEKRNAFKSWKEFKSTNLDRVLGVRKNADPMELIFQREAANEALSINIDISNQDTSTPEKYDNVQNSVALTKLKSLFEAKDDRIYNNKADLKRRYSSDSGLQDPRQAVAFYDDIYNPKQVPAEHLQAKTEAPLYNHVKYGFTSTIKNIIKSTAKLKETEGVLGTLDKITGFNDFFAADEFFRKLKSGIDKTEIMESPFAKEMFNSVDNLTGFSDFVDWASDVNSKIDVELAEWVQLDDDYAEPAPVGTEFKHQVAQGIGQGGVTIPLSMVNPSLGYLSNFSLMYGEALDQGLSSTDAIHYAEKAALLETIGDRLIASPIASLSKANIAVRVASKMGLNFVSEGTTEDLQYVMLQKMAGKKVSYVELWDNFTVGGTVGMLLGSSVELTASAGNKLKYIGETKSIISDLDAIIFEANQELDDIRVSAAAAALKAEIKAGNKDASREGLLTALRDAQPYILHGVEAEYNQELTPEDWRNLKPIDTASMDADTIDLFNNAVAGNIDAQRQYNNAIKTKRILRKISDGVRLSKAELKILKTQHKKDIKDAEPNSKELKEVYQSIITKTVSIPGLVPIIKSIGRSTHLKLYPKIARRIRAYEADINVGVHRDTKRFVDIIEGFKVAERIGDVGIPDFNINEIIDDLKLAVMNGDDVAGSLAALRQLVGYAVDKHGFINEEKAFLIEKKKKTVGDLTKKEKLEYDKRGINPLMLIKTRDTNLSTDSERQFKRVFYNAHQLLRGFKNTNNIQTYLSDAGSDAFPVQIKDIDGLRKHLGPSVEIKKGGLYSTATGEPHAITKDLLQFYENPAVALDTYINVVNRRRAKSSLFYDENNRRVEASAKLKKAVESLAVLEGRLKTAKNPLEAAIENFNNVEKEAAKKLKEAQESMEPTPAQYDAMKTEAYNKFKERLRNARGNTKAAANEFLDAEEAAKKALDDAYKVIEEVERDNDKLRRKARVRINTTGDADPVKVAKAQEAVDNKIKAIDKIKKSDIGARDIALQHEINDDGTIVEKDVDIANTDIMKLLAEEVDLDTAPQAEVDAILKNIKDIMTPDISNAFNRFWTRSAALKYVSGPTTVLKQYMDLSITMGDLMDFGSKNPIEYMIKGLFSNKSVWTDNGNDVNIDEFLEWIGAAMTSPDIEQVTVPASFNPVSYVKELTRISKDHKMNKSYKLHIADALTAMAETSSGKTKLEILELKTKILAGETIKKSISLYNTAEAYLLTALRMSDKFNRMHTINARVLQLQDAIKTDKVKALAMIVKIINDPAIAEQALEDIANLKLTPASRSVLYTIIADRQPINAGERSNAFRGQIAKPFGIFKSFAFKESARHVDMVVLPFLNSANALRTSTAYYRNALSKQNEIKNLDDPKLIAEATAEYNKLHKQAVYSAQLSSEFGKAWMKGLSLYAVFSVLPSTLLNMGLDKMLKGLGWKADDDDEETPMGTQFMMEYVGRLFPFISAYTIAKAIRDKDPALLASGMARLPLGVGSMMAWQLFAGAVDGDSEVDYNAMLEDIPVGGRYMQEYFNND